jgi:KTSC domain
VNRQDVSSSNLKSVGWEDNVLEVEFLDGGLYQYFDVPEAVYLGLMQAESAGKYFWANVRGAYRYARV